MKQGDFVYIEYVGKVKDTGEVFDLTNEELAKKDGIYNPNAKYRPVPVIIGADFVLKGLDEALQTMNVGEKKTIEVSVEKGFGERKPEFSRLIPMSVFVEQNINPNPGSYVTINGLNGRVVSSDGGRIRVDFNHPLAGKKLDYQIEIKNEIKDDGEKVMGIVTYFTNYDKEDAEVTIVDKTAEIKIKTKNELHNVTRDKVANTVLKWVGVEKVRFLYEYAK